MTDVRVGGPRHVVVHREEQVEKVQHTNRGSEIGVRKFHAEPETLWSTKNERPPTLRQVYNILISMLNLLYLLSSMNNTMARSTETYIHHRDKIMPTPTAVAHQKCLSVVPNNFPKSFTANFFFNIHPSEA